MNSCEADVTFIDLLPAGVCAELESRTNNHASRASIGLLIVVLAPAVIALAFLPIPHIINQELSATVVVDAVKLVVVVGQLEEFESGCQV